MLLEGDGNAVVMPTYRDGLIEDLIPLPPSTVTFNVGSATEDYYSISYNGKEYRRMSLFTLTLIRIHVISGKVRYRCVKGYREHDRS